MHPNAAAVVEGMANFSSGDHEALKKLFAEDAEWIYGGHSRFAGRYQGRDAIMRWMKEIHTEAETDVRPVGILASDRHVIVFNEVTAGHGEQRKTTTEAFCAMMNENRQITKFFQLNAEPEAFDASVGAS